MKIQPFFVAHIAVALCLAGNAVRAQDPDPSQNDQTLSGQSPAHVEYVEGDVSIQRDGQIEAADISQPIIEGDRVATVQGRVEILTGDGSALYVAEHTTLEFLNETRLRLLEGRATLIVARGAGAELSDIYQIDTPSASVQIDAPGEYRITATAGAVETELAVVRGDARLVTEATFVNVQAGERSSARDGSAPSAPIRFNSARWDDFDRWTNDRQAGRLSAVSRRYLPSEVQTYASTFDRYGAWGQESDYGYVWYPTAAAAGWRPYYNGYWNMSGGYGWNWVGYDPWAWPTHHYGRWGFRNSAWFWIPGRTWGPGWVNWAIAPGYVSWCPLGFNGQPVAGFWNSGFSAGFFHNPWSAWTVIPRQTFGNRTRVTSVAVDGRTLANNPRAAFIVQSRPPAFGNGMRRAGEVSDFRPRMPERVRGASPAGSMVTAPAVSASRGAITPGPRGSIRWEAGERDRGIPGGTFSVMGAQRPGRTAVTRDAPPMGGLYVGPQAPAENPYDRAARVARDRTPGMGRQPLRGDPITPGSPYPPRFQSPVPEPFRYVPTSPVLGTPAGGVFEHRGTPMIYPSPSASRGRPLSPSRGMGLAPSPGLAPMVRPAMGLTPRMPAGPAGSLPMISPGVVPRSRN